MKRLFGLCMLFVVLIASSCKKKDCDPAPVTAAFTYSFNVIEARGTDGGSTILFDNNSTNAKSYLWNFGDGTTSTEENPVHTFSNYSDKTVTLTATNGNSKATATVVIQFAS